MKLYRDFAAVVALLLAAAGSAWPQQSRDWIIGQDRAAKKQIEAIAAQDRAQPATLGPDWEKARAESAQLLTVAKEIHDQVQAGPEQVPAPLAKKLKEVQRLVKQLQKDLLL